jgi:hypothetical protein
MSRRQAIRPARDPDHPEAGARPPLPGRGAGWAWLSPVQSTLGVALLAAVLLYADLQQQLMAAEVGRGRDPLDVRAGWDALESLVMLKLPGAMLLALTLGLVWMKAGVGLPLPEWLFPVRGRWLGLLVCAGMVVLPAAALVIPGPFGAGTLSLLCGAMLVPVLAVRLLEVRGRRLAGAPGRAKERHGC